MKTVIPVILLLCSCVFAYGLEPSGFNLVGFPEFARGFQPEFSSQVSFSFSSGRYGSTGMGTYLGSMHFSLHPKVDAVVEMGYSRLLRFSGDGDQFGSVLGGFQLNWRPSENTSLSVVYRGALPEENLNLGGF